MPSDGVTIAVEQIVRGISRIAATDAEFNHSIDLHDTGYLDSLGIVVLTAQIEQTLGIRLTEEDLFDPQFTSIAGIASIVRTKLHNRYAAH